jgi:hypothetical protein
MVIAIVQHFLNEEGQRRFPEWLARVAREASRYDGFVSLRRLSVQNDLSGCFMLLEFADSERVTILAEQEPYRVRELQSQRFIASAPIEP